jgi:hypothetical protein
VPQVASFICLLYNSERFVLRYDTNISGLGTPDLSCREFRVFNPEIVRKFFNSERGAKNLKLPSKRYPNLIQLLYNVLDKIV